MSVLSIAFNNFKNNVKTYKMFVLSMIFSVIILINFLILINGEALQALGDANASYAKMVLQIISVILAMFMFFFIWYTSNVFLRNRKKEIGLFTFMGVDLRTIGKIYFSEMMLIGIASSVIGIGIGVLFSKFFQMIVFAAAGFKVDVKFGVGLNSSISAFLIFMAIFLFMSIKGFINIAKSKVIDLLNDSRKTEKMPKITLLTYIIGAASIALIGLGYYLVLGSKRDAVKALILVCIGTYGLFYAVIPAVLKVLINNKNVLYKGENIITINSLAYRIKKNYTTYATIGILTACTITVLGTAVSMKNLYTMSEQNDQLYSISFYSGEKMNTKKISEEVTSVLGDKKYDLSTDALIVRNVLVDVPDYKKVDYLVLPYDKFTDILKVNGNEDDLENVNEEMVKDNNVIFIQRPGTLASLVGEREVNLQGKDYTVSEGGKRFKVLGSIFDYPTVIVNDETYENLKANGEKVNFYGIKLASDDEIVKEDVVTKLGESLQSYVPKDVKSQIGIYKTKSVEWLKIIYSIGAFLFLVFVLAEASIIYIKIYSDANEDKDKYKVLKNIGARTLDLNRAISKEVALFYILPLSIGLLHSFFAIKVLGKFLSENLIVTFIISVSVSLIIFMISAVISIKSFKNIVRI